MKKPVLFLFSFILLFSLCGCSFKETLSSHNGEYIISAIGFDGLGDKIGICLEAVIVNTEDTDAERRLELIEGSGNTVEEAFYNASKKTSQPFMLSHCSIIALGEGISPKRFTEINDFCYSSGEITLSAMFVGCKKATALLSSQAISSVAVGYDIASMLEQQSRQTGINYKNCFYEIKAFKGKPLNTFSLPFLELTETGYYISGLKIYKDYSETAVLGNNETSLYAIITDTQSKGELMLEGESVKIGSSYTTWNFEKDDKLKINLILKLQTENGTDNHKKSIKRNIESLFYTTQQKGMDIFGLGNIIYNKERDIWEDVKENYEENFKNSVLTVELI